MPSTTAAFRLLVAGLSLAGTAFGAERDGAKAGRLQDSGSAFLLRHATDPVDWYPWGPEAFEKARSENKPVFVSIGYDSCHWCYRMQRETFSDPAMATLMNEHFVNVLVDRAQRPDLNATFMAYMKANQGDGGWPLNVWLTPDRVPFSVGSYFPGAKETPATTPTFGKAIAHIIAQWKRFPDYIVNQSNRDLEKIRDHLKSIGPLPDDRPVPPVDAIATALYESIAARFDPANGGFTQPAKFPQASSLAFLGLLSTLETKESFRQRQILKMLDHSARAMTRGGFFDQVGGGFHAYALDTEWQLPRFEKMLPVQADLIDAYSRIYALLPDPLYADTVRQTIDFANRELRLPSGLFKCGLHSDSPAEAGMEILTEGAYYTWSHDAFARAVAPDDLPVLVAAFGVRPDGNLSPGAGSSRTFAGLNVLRRERDDAEIARSLGIPEAEVAAAVRRGLSQLKEARALRPRPADDTLVSTGWNALYASALATAYLTFGDPSDLETAKTCVDALLATRYDKESARLTHSESTPGSGSGLFATTYALTIQALLDLYDATSESSYLSTATELQERQIELFRDKEDGGIFEFVPGTEDAPPPIAKIEDDPESRTQSITMENLLRLGDLTGEERYLGFAGLIGESSLFRILLAGEYAPAIVSQSLLLARPPLTILLTNTLPDSDLARGVRALARRHPDLRASVILLDANPIPTDTAITAQWRKRFADALEGAGTEPAATIGGTSGFSLPLTTLEAVEQALSAR